jgi:hypothetical protein
MAAPLGNKNATKNKPWAEALNRALLAEDGKKLRSLAEKLIERAEGGDISALKEIGDRMDGKAAQAITGPDGEPLLGPLVGVAEELRKALK